VESPDLDARPDPPCAIEAFAGDDGTRWPKAVAKIIDDAEEVLCMFNSRLSAGSV
jgi:hypothetical protein